MKDNNKRNLLYFKANTMDKLHSEMDIWQKDNEKRFLSMSVEKDGDNFCCIALTNPSEVTIKNDSIDVRLVGVDTQDWMNVEVRHWSAGTLDTYDKS